MTEFLDKWDGDIIRALRFQDEEICELAAAEIERLRKDLSLAVFADNEYWQVLERENERLRAALHRIGLPRAKIFYCRDGHEEAVLIARAALEGKHD